MFKLYVIKNFLERTYLKSFKRRKCKTKTEFFVFICEYLTAVENGNRQYFIKKYFKLYVGVMFKHPLDVA